MAAWDTLDQDPTQWETGKTESRPDKTQRQRGQHGSEPSYQQSGSQDDSAGWGSINNNPSGQSAETRADAPQAADDGWGTGPKSGAGGDGWGTGVQGGDQVDTSAPAGGDTWGQDGGQGANQDYGGGYGDDGGGFDDFEPPPFDREAFLARMKKSAAALGKRPTRNQLIDNAKKAGVPEAPPACSKNPDYNPDGQRSSYAFGERDVGFDDSGPRNSFPDSQNEGFQGGGVQSSPGRTHDYHEQRSDRQQTGFGDEGYDKPGSQDQYRNGEHNQQAGGWDREPRQARNQYPEDSRDWAGGPQHGNDQFRGRPEAREDTQYKAGLEAWGGDQGRSGDHHRAGFEQGGQRQGNDYYQEGHGRGNQRRGDDYHHGGYDQGNQQQLSRESEGWGGRQERDTGFAGGRPQSQEGYQGSRFDEGRQDRPGYGQRESERSFGRRNDGGDRCPSLRPREPYSPSQDRPNPYSDHCDRVENFGDGGYGVPKQFENDEFRAHREPREPRSTQITREWDSGKEDDWDSRPNQEPAYHGRGRGFKEPEPESQRYRNEPPPRDEVYGQGERRASREDWNQGSNDRQQARGGGWDQDRGSEFSHNRGERRHRDEGWEQDPPRRDNGGERERYPPPQRGEYPSQLRQDQYREHPQEATYGGGRGQHDRSQDRPAREEGWNTGGGGGWDERAPQARQEFPRHESYDRQSQDQGGYSRPSREQASFHEDSHDRQGQGYQGRGGWESQGPRESREQPSGAGRGVQGYSGGSDWEAPQRGQAFQEDPLQRAQPPRREPSYDREDRAPRDEQTGGFERGDGFDRNRGPQRGGQGQYEDRGDRGPRRDAQGEESWGSQAQRGDSGWDNPPAAKERSSGFQQYEPEEEGWGASLPKGPPPATRSDDNTRAPKRGEPADLEFQQPAQAEGGWGSKPSKPDAPPTEDTWGTGGPSGGDTWGAGGNSQAADDSWGAGQTGQGDGGEAEGDASFEDVPDIPPVQLTSEERRAKLLEKMKLLGEPIVSRKTLMENAKKRDEAHEAREEEREKCKKEEAEARGETYIPKVLKMADLHKDDIQGWGDLGDTAKDSGNDNSGWGNTGGGDGWGASNTPSSPPANQNPSSQSKPVDSFQRASPKQPEEDLGGWGASKATPAPAAKAAESNEWGVTKSDAPPQAKHAPHSPKEGAEDEASGWGMSKPQDQPDKVYEPKETSAEWSGPEQTKGLTSEQSRSSTVKEPEGIVRTEIARPTDLTPEDVDKHDEEIAALLSGDSAGLSRIAEENPAGGEQGVVSETSGQEDQPPKEPSPPASPDEAKAQEDPRPQSASPIKSVRKPYSPVRPDLGSEAKKPEVIVEIPEVSLTQAPQTPSPDNTSTNYTNPAFSSSPKSDAASESSPESDLMSEPFIPHGALTLEVGNKDEDKSEDFSFSTGRSASAVSTEEGSPKLRVRSPAIKSKQGSAEVKNLAELGERLSAEAGSEASGETAKWSTQASVAETELKEGLPQSLPAASSQNDIIFKDPHQEAEDTPPVQVLPHTTQDGIQKQTPSNKRPFEDFEPASSITVASKSGITPDEGSIHQKANILQDVLPGSPVITALRETNGSEGKPRAPFGAGSSAKAPPGDDAEKTGAEIVDFKIDDVD